MDYIILSNFFDYLNDKFQGQIPNLIFFAFGLIIGFIIFLLIILIVLIVSKHNQKVMKKEKIEPLQINPHYKNIISAQIDIYNTLYKDEDLKEKGLGILKIILDMMEEISSLYYPDSNEPIFEISIDQLVDFLQYLTFRINYVIDNLLEGKLKFIDVITNHKAKQYKLSFIGKLIEKNQIKKENDEPIKDSIFSKLKGSILGGLKKVGTKLGSNLIDSEFYEIIYDLGEDINKLYSRQPLDFKDLTKKQLKMLKKENKTSVKS